MPNEVREALAIITAYVESASRTQPAQLEGYGELLSPADISELTGLHANTVRDLIKAGELHGCRIGQRLYVSKQNFIEYINHQGGLQNV